jgi:hypothetical protein
MLSATFTIFNATKALPPRNNLPPWAENQKIWPQVLLISIASIMLAVCIWVFYSYWKGGHRRAEKTSVYYSAFAVGFFIFSIVMWGIAAGALQGSKNNSNNKDMWGWSCVDNQRKSLFEKEIQYDLVCRLQNWSLVCIIIEYTALSSTDSTQRTNCANRWPFATGLDRTCTLLSCAHNPHQTRQGWQALSAHAMVATSRQSMPTSTGHLLRRVMFNTSTQATSLHPKPSSSKHHQYACRPRLPRWHKLASLPWKHLVGRDRARLRLQCQNKTNAVRSWPRFHGSSNKSTSAPLQASECTTLCLFPALTSQ